MRRLPFVLLALLLVQADAGAQIIRQRYQLNGPSAWVSVGAGIQQGFTVTDGTTNRLWEFSDATEYSASLEKTLSGGASIGLRGGTAKVPLRYSAVGGSSLMSTDADANVSHLFGTLHVANGREFHSVLELSVGATVYSNFRARDDGRKLDPISPDADFAFAFGYGFGYAFSPNFSIDIVQDQTTSLHQKTGLSAGDNSSVRIQGTRLVGRIGL